MKRLATTLTAAAIALVFGSNAQAVPLTLDTDGVVGILEGMVQGQNGSSLANELIIANQILALVGIDQVVVAATPPGIVCGNGANAQAPCEYRNGDNNYNNVLSGGVKGTNGDNTVNDAGAVWALAKYDGQNAGYVLFYLPDFGTTLPQIPWEIWGNQNDQGFALSHYTVFTGLNTCPPNDPDCDITFTPDGGSTMTLLGSALLAIGMATRKFRKS
jgi:hypothetical protein